MVIVSGWFESDRGAVMFKASGEGLYAAASQMAKKFGADAVGVDREAEVDSSDVVSREADFWKFYDSIVAGRKAGML